MAYTKEYAPNIWRTLLDGIFMTEFEMESLPGILTPLDSVLFKQIKIDNGAYTSAVQSPARSWTKSYSQTQEPVKQNPVETSLRVVEVADFMSDLEIAENLLKDGNSSVPAITKLTKSFGRKARHARMKAAGELIAGMFTSTTANNGIPVISNSQQTLYGQTVDNLIPGTASDEVLENMVAALMVQPDMSGDIAGFTTDGGRLVCAPAQFGDFCRITKSELRSGTGNNDLNYFSMLYPGLEVVQSPFFSAANGYSDTAFILISAASNIERIIRQDIETDFVEPILNKQRFGLYRGKFREDYTVGTYEGIVGCLGV